ncbi:acyl-CoA ligase (AMP-forming), exosortase A system-associated [Anatilimnocola sp. NA78]|uniref:acyl-CoA ligase (AMP-forming), exosortase A system-associated n=1 Tax=Anatilimnocola sp. NA78 TaxID=3415683 RepID=UPI003CE51B54
MQFLIHHLLRDSAARRPEQEALVHGKTRLNYAQAQAAAVSLGAILHQAGTKRLDRVGVLLEPSCELALSLFGISQAGGVFVPIHHGLFPEQVEHIVRDCSMTGIVIDVSRWKQLQPILEACDSLQFVILVGHDEAHTRLKTFRYSVADTATATATTEQAIDKDLAAILYTSGSTGKPKGVMLSHANVVAGASIVSDYLGITSADRILAVLPFSFDAGLNQLTTAIQQGGTCVMMKFLFAKEIVNMLAKERITGLAGVPPLWSLIAQDSSTLATTALPHLRYITNTGGAMPLSTLQRLRAAVPETQVVLMYGLTEAFRSTYLPPAELDRRPTSMGKAIPNTEILVLNEEGRLCAPGEIGELVHRGPTVSLGYWGQPELTDKVLRPNPLLPPEVSNHEKVCYSGDLVKTDEDGFLYFVGRRDNQIKSSGFRISPTEVEEALCRTGQLRDAAVIGLPDEVLGQRIKAFVVPREGVAISQDQLVAHVATLLPRHMVPKVVEVLGELPKTSSGKINYPALRQREAGATT